MKTLFLISALTLISLVSSAQYSKWLKGRERDTTDYDMHGAYMAGLSNKGHLPDTFKKPNHITFSTDSKYPTAAHTGGVWQQRGHVWYYTPSAWVLSQHSKSELIRYFRHYEKESIIIFK